ncbi:sialic acid-binding Ig-like lectin 10 isoform X2 [Denticeps clupeoides]|uniref:B-cell receptor CD22 n=1 Tax=Denticeps clupeoides TaxID=299321 RepID=A0AAY4CMM2_9TELE|nr:sialic acid-binding Ig-like lectin 10 isoform X2 [Denticeps clupeoides]
MHMVAHAKTQGSYLLFKMHTKAKPPDTIIRKATFCGEDSNMLLRWGITLLLMTASHSKSESNSEDCVTQLEGKKSATAKAGSCVTIRCTVSATGRSPYDTEYWIKDWVWTNNTHIGIIVRSNTAVHPVAQEYDGRTALVDSHSCSLQICNLQKTDEGYYSFRVSRSKCKYITDKFELKIEDNPCQVETKPSVIVLENEDVNLECSTSAACESAPEWLTSGLDPRFKSPPNSSKSNKTSVLEFRADQQDDGRVLSCQPRGNQDGFLVRTVTVTVQYAPENVHVHADPDLSDITKGDPLTLKCTVQRSNPRHDCTWYKDSEFKTADCNLLFSSVQPADTGNYSCQANNSVGSISNMLQINVKYGPQNTKIILDSSTVKEGSSLDLRCEANAYPSPHVHFWYYDPGHSSASERLPETNKILHFKQIRVQDSGKYVCRAKNSISAGDNSSWISLNVLYRPHNLNLIMNSSITEFQMLVIICTVKSNPTARLTLLRDGAIPQSLYSTYNNSLQFELKVSFTHAGCYTCVAENSEGKNNVTKVLNVNYAPKNVSIRVDPHVVMTEGERLTLTCTTQAHPSVSSYTWLHSGDRREGETLILTHLSAASRGQYTCEVRNEIGVNSSSVNIRVKYAPKETTIKHNITGRSQNDMKTPVSLTCIAESDPPPHKYTWYKVTYEVDHPVSSHQNITVAPTEPGTYYCVVENELSTKRSENIQLFQTSELRRWFLLLIFLLFIVIFLVLLLYRIHKRKFAQQNGEESSCLHTSNALLLDSHIGTTENLIMPDVEPLISTSSSQQNPQARRQCPENQPHSKIHTVYDVLKMPHMIKNPSPRQAERNQCADEMDDAVNYATLNFRDNRSKMTKEADVVYAKVKTKSKIEDTSLEQSDYENFSGASHLRHAANADWESNDSDEDTEVNYSVIAFKQNQSHSKTHSGGSSLGEDSAKTVYSFLKIS